MENKVIRKTISSSQYVDAKWLSTYRRCTTCS